MSTVLACHDLTLRYRGSFAEALKGVTFSMRAGERVALLGLNGSGKSSLLYALAGLYPVSGAVEINGMTLDKKNLRQARDQLGFLFSTPDDQLLFPRVLDDVAFALERRGQTRVKAQEAALEMLAQLGIAHLAESAPHRLSHGQRQRVALAGALIARPPLLLLDEPTSALDPPGRGELLRELNKLPCAILLATHDVAFARRLARRFIVLEEGGISADTEDPAVTRQFEFL